MREELILRKMRQGDPEALETLMDRYIPYVSTIVWNILRNAMTKEDAEEVVSDVFLVRRAIDKLGEPDHEIFLRHYYYAQTVSEISWEMHLNPSTIKTKLSRGRQRLKTLLMRWEVL